LSEPLGSNLPTRDATTEYLAGMRYQRQLDEAEIETLRAALREIREELNTMEADPKMLNRIIREALRDG
jgi:hypothetical protein